jgi:general secretion pathway protein C
MLLVVIALGGCGSSAPAVGTSAPAAGSSLDDASAGRAISDSDFAVTREWAAAFRADPNAVARLLRLEPVEQEARVVGMRVFGVRAGSIVDVLGFRNGDVLESVNGAPVAETPSFEGDTFVVVLRREGVERTHTVHVVDRLD